MRLFAVAAETDEGVTEDKVPDEEQGARETAVGEVTAAMTFAV